MASIQPVTTNKQIREVVHLAKEIWTDHYTPIIGAAQVDYMLDKYQSQHAISDQINDGYQYYLIAHHGKNVGYFSFSLNDDVLFLSKFYVLKTQRGHGLGRKAMLFMEEKTQQGKIPKIRLTVNKYNSNAIAAYKKMGFVEVDSIVQHIGQGYVMDDYVLEKKMAPSP